MGGTTHRKRTRLVIVIIVTRAIIPVEKLVYPVLKGSRKRLTFVVILFVLLFVVFVVFVIVALRLAYDSLKSLRPITAKEIGELVM